MGQAKLKGSYAQRCEMAVKVRPANCNDISFIKHGYKVGIEEGVITEIEQLDRHLESVLAGETTRMKSRNAHGEGFTYSLVSSKFLVALKEGVPVGFVQISFNIDQDDNTYNEILYIFVDASLRDKKVAQSLIKAAINSLSRLVELRARIIKGSSFSGISEKLLSKFEFCVVDETKYTKFLICTRR